MPCSVRPPSSPPVRGRPCERALRLADIWEESGDAAEVEYDSVRRVEQGGLFRGMSREGMLSRARNTSLLELQRGAVDLLSSFRGQWGIVSVGWSAQFLSAALEARRVDLRSYSRQPVRIAANEVEFDAATGLGTGMISKHEGNSNGIRVASEKRREMRRMVDEWRAGLSLSEDGDRVKGDEADRGTVVVGLTFCERERERETGVCWRPTDGARACTLVRRRLGDGPSLPARSRRGRHHEQPEYGRQGPQAGNACHCRRAAGKERGRGGEERTCALRCR